MKKTKAKKVIFKEGDLVKMVNCMEAEPNKDVVWECETDSFTSDCGIEVVFLKGFSGYFACEYLELVKKAVK